jgi:CHASE3 domain sensor protein
MARGWESKSVEAQIEDAGSRSERGQALTPEQRELKRRREGIELSRRRVLQELATTRSAARRASLEQALAFLDAELAKLEPLPPA